MCSSPVTRICETPPSSFGQALKAEKSLTLLVSWKNPAGSTFPSKYACRHLKARTTTGRRPYLALSFTTVRQDVFPPLAERYGGSEFDNTINHSTTFLFLLGEFRGQTAAKCLGHLPAGGTASSSRNFSTGCAGDNMKASKFCSPQRPWLVYFHAG